MIPEESALGYSANSSFGIDNVKLGFPTDESPAITHQIVEGIATKEFDLGRIGLNPTAINISSFNNPNASVLTNFKAQGKIPSRSWAYTAGASYRQPNAFGSLTLGGYDTNRFVPNNVTIPFGADSSRDLLLGLQSITTDVSTAPLLSLGIYVFLDSLVPDLWLPAQVCQMFQNTFGLTYVSTANRYFVNDTIHAKLLAQNPNVTFTLGLGTSGGDTVNITMQYGSFDLLDKGELNVGNGTRYFPLRQANDYTHYTFGLAFFQDAYVIADYERGNFSVSQAIFPNSSTSLHLVPIYPPGEERTVVHHSPLSKGAIVGVTLAFAVLLTLVGVMWWLRRKREVKKRTRQGMIDRKKGSDKLSPAFGTVLWDGKQYEASAESRARIPELLGGKIQELRTVHNNGYELPTGYHINELPAHESEHEIRRLKWQLISLDAADPPEFGSGWGRSESLKYRRSRSV